MQIFYVDNEIKEKVAKHKVIAPRLRIKKMEMIYGGKAGKVETECPD